MNYGLGTSKTEEWDVPEPICIHVFVHSQWFRYSYDTYGDF